jgi:gamma-glutamyltranspeptidase/glutathione hydrolase|tara:strand:+ start:1020 stop:2735 length:1716 start_codon:yes stop_codon:yes gene_type:complete
MKKILTPFISLLVLQTLFANDLPIIEYQAINHPVIDNQGMVVSQRKIASEVGAQILKEGGNAVDAAVATGLALAVVLPRAGNLGGGGFMIIHLKEEDRNIAIDYREKAPSGAFRDLFLDENGNYDKKKAQFSLLSAGVPGSVAGFHHALMNYGTLSWEEVLKPAIRLAEEGFEIPHDLANTLASKRYRARLSSNEAAAKVFYKEDKSLYKAGEILVQNDLANTLRQLSEFGPDAFYKGEIAKLIVKEMERNGGLITLEDLSNYQIAERKPLNGQYKDYKIVSMPPSSSGGTHLIQMLNMLEEFPIKEMGFGSAESIHILAEVMKRAYADRSKYLGDTDFYKVPSSLTSKDYAKSLNAFISKDKITPSDEISAGNPFPYESPDTTHFSVMDSFGNAVSNTYTLNFSYGSGMMIPGTGMLINNEMDDFSSKPGTPNGYGLLGSEANAIEGNKRPLSSMTPTIIFKNDEPYMVFGSPGGSRIITTVLQVALNVMDHDMNIAQAVHSPRIHHQWLPEILMIESGFGPDTERLLTEKGYKLYPSSTMGSVQAIMKEGDYFYGSADPRRPSAGVAIP